MNRTITLLLNLIIASVLYAGETDAIALGSFVANEDSAIPTEAASLLQNRMQRIIAANGFADTQATGRFALVAKCDIIEKDIAPTTPPRISQKIELSFVVVDLIENKIYGGCDMTLSGIGTNETKTYSSAFQKVSTQNQQLKTLLSESKDKILSYYTNSCPQIMTEARTLASTGQYDKAIFSLMSVPAICTECFNNCRTLATEIYQRKIDHDCSVLIQRANNLWAASPTETTASEIAAIISSIDPAATNYDTVVELRKKISAKLTADARREWEFQMKKYEDNQQFKRSIVDACRSVGEIFAKNFQLPQINLFKRY